MIIHYNFYCPNCRDFHLDLSEGTMCFGSDAIYRNYKCDKCKIVKDLCQHDSHTCQCGNEMILWNEKCLRCGTPMNKTENGICDIM